MAASRSVGQLLLQENHIGAIIVIAVAIDRWRTARLIS